MTLHPISGKSYFLVLALLLMSVFAPAQTAVPVVLAPVPQLQFFDASGRPLSFGCVFTFQSQTTTTLKTYSDFTGQYENQNPVLLNAGGSANIWLQSGQAYSLVVKSSGGNNCALGQTLYAVDGVGGGASQLNTVVTPSGGSAAFTVQSQNQLFSLTLTGNVAGSPVSFIGVIAPVLVTFQITEDGVGGRSFSWPSNVIGAAPIDTVANHVTSQTFIWNGTTIMPVGSGFTSQGNAAVAGIVSATGAIVTNPGVFTNTQMNLYLQSLLNGCNPGTEFHANFGGSNNASEGVTGCINIPVGSTVFQSNTVAGYVNNSSGAATAGVAIFGNARVTTTAGGRIWGGNFVATGFAGFASNSLYSTENDCNVANTADVCHGMLVAGNFTAQPVTTDGITISAPGQSGACTVCTWPYGIRFAQGATGAVGLNNAAIAFLPLASGTNQASQGVEFLANDPSSGQNGAGLFESADGWLTTQNTKAATGFSAIQLRVTAGLSADGGGFKHKRFGATCTTTTSIGNSCTTTFSWTTAFADANYSPVCSPIGPANGPVFSMDSFNAAGVTVRVYTFVALASGYSGVDCYGVHD